MIKFCFLVNYKGKLTEKELKRKEHFEKLNSEMQQKGYKITNMIIDIRQANCLGPLSMLPFMAIIFWIYYTVNGFDLEGISLGFAVVFFLSEFMILSGGGDFLITLKILLYRTHKKKSVYCDHPYECGFVVFEK